MSQTRQEIRDKIESYLTNEEKFETKGNGAAGKRARAELLDISKLAKIRRLEIQEKRNSKNA